jgi:tetratricopeptide (TPR) repeat protein
MDGGSLKIEELKAALTKYSGYVTSEITKHAFGSSREGDWYKLWTDVTDFVWPTLLQDRQQRDAPSSSNLALDEGRDGLRILAHLPSIGSAESSPNDSEKESLRMKNRWNHQKKKVDFMRDVTLGSFKESVVLEDKNLSGSPTLGPLYEDPQRILVGRDDSTEGNTDEGLYDTFDTFGKHNDTLRNSYQSTKPFSPQSRLPTLAIPLFDTSSLIKNDSEDGDIREEMDKTMTNEDGTSNPAVSLSYDLTDEGLDSWLDNPKDFVLLKNYCEPLLWSEKVAMDKIGIQSYESIETIEQRVPFDGYSFEEEPQLMHEQTELVTPSPIIKKDAEQRAKRIPKKKFKEMRRLKQEGKAYKEFTPEELKMVQDVDTSIGELSQLRMQGSYQESINGLQRIAEMLASGNFPSESVVDILHISLEIAKCMKSLSRLTEAKETLEDIVSCRLDQYRWALDVENMGEHVEVLLNQGTEEREGTKEASKRRAKVKLFFFRALDLGISLFELGECHRLLVSYSECRACFEKAILVIDSVSKIGEAVEEFVGPLSSVRADIFLSKALVLTVRGGSNEAALSITQNQLVHCEEDLQPAALQSAYNLKVQCIKLLIELSEAKISDAILRIDDVQPLLSEHSSKITAATSTISCKETLKVEDTAAQLGDRHDGHSNIVDLTPNPNFPPHQTDVKAATRFEGNHTHEFQIDPTSFSLRDIGWFYLIASRVVLEACNCSRALEYTRMACEHLDEFYRPKPFPKDLLYAEIQTARGATFSMKGDFDQAKGSFFAAQVLLKSIFPPDHICLTNIAIQLAELERRRGYPSIALLELRPILSSMEKITFLTGNRSFATELILAASLATVEGSKEEEINLQLLLDCVQISRKIKGDEHPNVGWGYIQLLKYSLMKQNFSEAEKYSTAAIYISACHGDENLLHAETTFQIGEIKAAKLDHSSAKEHFLEALQVRQKLLGNRHFSLVPCLRRLAICAFRVDDQAEANQCLALVQKIQTQHEAVS